VKIALSLAGLVLCCLVAALLWRPLPVQEAEHWVIYRVTGYLPPPIVIGRNGRLFLGNHDGSPPNSLIRDVCGAGVGQPAIDRAEAVLRPVLAAGRAAGLPFRFLVVPTAPRIYPEDVPASIPCADWSADRLAHALDDPDLVYPVAPMQAMKAQFDVLPRRHFHWAGEGPLRVAEVVADGMGLTRATTLALRPDNRSSDLNGFYVGVGLHDRIGNPDLRAAGVSQCWGMRCNPAIPESIVAFTRPGPGRLLVIADSFGDEIGGDFSEYAGQVWLVRMNLAVETPDAVAAALRTFHPGAIVVVYHDAGALALDLASQNSLALAARLLGDAGLPSRLTAP
jgi:hypothetical protein